MPPCKGCLLGCEDKTCILGAQREEIDDRHPPTMLLLLPRCRCLQRAISGLCLRGSSFPLPLSCVFFGASWASFLASCPYRLSFRASDRFRRDCGMPSRSRYVASNAWRVPSIRRRRPAGAPCRSYLFLFVLLHFVVALRLFLFVGFLCHLRARGGRFHEETFRGGVLWTR